MHTSDPKIIKLEVCCFQFYAAVLDHADGPTDLTKHVPHSLVHPPRSSKGRMLREDGGPCHSQA